MKNARPVVGHPLPPRAPVPAPAARRQTDPVWADAWRESPAVEQTLARLTDALSRDQRTANAPRVHPYSGNRRARPVRRRASQVAAALCVAVLAGLSGLAVAYGWQSDGLGIGRGISALLSNIAPASNPLEPPVVAPQPSVVVASEPVEKVAEESLARATPVEKTAAAAEPGKSVATTKLIVADASGEALHYIPLSISTDTPAGTSGPAIKLTGLPTETVLTSGEDLGNGSWFLKPGEEQNLKLAVQSNAPREIVIGVEAIEMKTGELAAPPQDLRVKVLAPKLLVQPAADTIKPAIVPTAEPAAAAPPAAAKIVPALELPPLPPVDEIAPEPEVKIAAAEPAVPAPPEVKIAAVEPAAAPPEVKIAAVDPIVTSTVEPSGAATAAPTGSADPALISRGDSLMSMGEVIGARSFYHRAYNRGEMAAARNIARTYDPLIYADLNVMGLKPNAEKALEWYRKAKAAGVAAAASDIAALEAYLASP